MIHIDGTLHMPMYQQIYEQLKKKILTGTFKEGDRLTPTRVFAKNFCVSRNTVENAYSQLCLEGYVLNKPGSGFIVQNMNDQVLIAEQPKEPVHESDDADQSPLTSEESEKYLYDFQYGNLDIPFPYSLWRRFTAEVLLSLDARRINSYNDKQGELDLRIQIMKYLQEARAVSCTPDQIVLCCGTQYALDLVCKLFSDGNRKLAMEEPGYNGARTVFENNGFEILPIPVQSDGIQVSTLERSSAKLAYITPSHQFPTGVVMPIQNRFHLLHWATEANGIIIEDDYDSELRYHARPIPALQSLDTSGRVIYMGTFSKSLSPGLRMGYMILPKWLLPKYHAMFARYSSSIPWLEQKIVSLYMAGGHWERHLRKICLYNKKKHDIMLKTITQLMGDKVIIQGSNAGLHILLEFANGEKQNWLIDKAKEYQVKVYPTTPFWHATENRPENTLLLGFSMLNEKEIFNGLTLLNKAWFGHK
ncbi:MocR-like pyridoxine biosynthesis transcription factor PdxR [Pelosinus propionicus]|uniref:Transcriptional regulator, GntR family n=1 Tax=Pelosinus propionicus DSM 13327 TaxID=1123291 RepID=A0A1I4KAB7_9FIRM|nr:PLP-dependent aminotransferase family protein [Pelosinus propionicus]SFL75782.1 transcriptional regulator, GntR family [Pelosinus propionicus DSM 13327]